MNRFTKCEVVFKYSVVGKRKLGELHRKASALGCSRQDTLEHIRNILILQYLIGYPDTLIGRLYEFCVCEIDDVRVSFSSRVYLDDGCFIINTTGSCLATRKLGLVGVRFHICGRFVYPILIHILGELIVSVRQDLHRPSRCVSPLCRW